MATNVPGPFDFTQLLMPALVSRGVLGSTVSPEAAIAQSM